MELCGLIDPVAQAGFSGVVRVDVPGEAPWTRAYGLADRRHGIAMTVDSQLALASGSKSFTALAVLSLVADGRLALSTPARAVLGADLPLIDDAVTVEQLLGHRSGIGDYLDEDAETDVADYPMPVSVHRLARTEDFLPILDGHPTKFPPGQRFSYCNGGYVVLALIAERVGGLGYHDLVRQRVFAPAGMADSDFLRSDDLPGRAAVGYVQVDGVERTNVFHLPVLGTGDGGAYSTVADIHRFWTALFAEAILPADLVATMLRPRKPGPDGDRDYGLGFWLRSSRGAVQLEGCDAGVSFRSVRDGRTGAEFTVISNTTDGAWPVARALDGQLGLRD